MRYILLFLIVISTFLGTVISASEQSSRVLFQNVSIFNGKSDKLQHGMNVLVEGNQIKIISETVISAKDAFFIDAKGRTLMPGLIDNHVHFTLSGKGVLDIEANMTWEDLAIGQVAMAKMYLEEGFTTVRDMGGTNGGLNRAINAGLITGPRVYPSAALIGPRGGHSDFATYSSRPGDESQLERLNISRQANGVDEVMMAVRNNFRQGASQIKIMQTGGVASLFDPWQLNGMTENEISAAVEVADGYQSYVGAHSYSKDAIMRALNMGVKTIEHGFMFDGDVAMLMKKKGGYLSTNMTAFSPLLAGVAALANPHSKHKLKTAQAAFGGFLDNVRKYKPKRGYNTDCVGNAKDCRKQVAYEKFLNGEFFGNHRALVSMTSVGGEIAALSGPLVNPFPDTKLGVIEEGATADILIVDGDPLKDLSVIGAIDKWFDAPKRGSVKTIRVIMKDGVIYKNTL